MTTKTLEKSKKIAITKENTMEYNVTLQVPDALMARVKITNMSVFANQAVKEALERESQQTQIQEKEKAIASVLNLRPIQGTNPQSSTEILRKERDFRSSRNVTSQS